MNKKGSLSCQSIIILPNDLCTNWIELDRFGPFYRMLIASYSAFVGVNSKLLCIFGGKQQPILEHTTSYMYVQEDYKSP